MEKLVAVLLVYVLERMRQVFSCAFARSFLNDAHAVSAGLERIDPPGFTRANPNGVPRTSPEAVMSRASCCYEVCLAQPLRKVHEKTTPPPFTYVLCMLWKASTLFSFEQQQLLRLAFGQ